MVFNVTPFQPDPALAGPWEADVTGDLFWYFQNESDCAKYTSNCSDHGQVRINYLIHFLTLSSAMSLLNGQVGPAVA